MRKGYHILFTNAVENLLDGGEECVGTFIMLGFNPFSLEYSPQSLGNVEMWRIWRQIDYVEVAVLPLGNFCFDLLAFVKAGIIQQQHGRLGQLWDNPVDEFNEFVGVDILLCCESVIFVIPVDHAIYIQAGGFLCRDANICKGIGDGALTGIAD